MKDLFLLFKMLIYVNTYCHYRARSFFTPQEKLVNRIFLLFVCLFCNVLQSQKKSHSPPFLLSKEMFNVVWVNWSFMGSKWRKVKWTKGEQKVLSYGLLNGEVPCLKWHALTMQMKCARCTMPDKRTASFYLDATFQLRWMRKIWGKEIRWQEALQKCRSLKFLSFFFFSFLSFTL